MGVGPVPICEWPIKRLRWLDVPEVRECRPRGQFPRKCSCSRDLPSLYVANPIGRSRVDPRPTRASSDRPFDRRELRKLDASLNCSTLPYTLPQRDARRPPPLRAPTFGWLNVGEKECGRLRQGRQRIILKWDNRKRHIGRTPFPTGVLDDQIPTLTPANSASKTACRGACEGGSDADAAGRKTVSATVICREI